MLTLEQCATLACILDVSAPKPGNVHRGADFEDATFVDFALSAVAVGPTLARAPQQRLGRTILESVRATKNVTVTNTNLGIILLLAPLAAVGRCENRSSALRDLLGELDASDARDVYEAIRLAEPGGLGSSDHMDVRNATPTDLLAAMRCAQDRDSIARQYATNFQLVRETIAPALVRHARDYGLITGILEAYLETLCREPDSLIARKCGAEVALEASVRAERVIAAGPTGTPERWQATADFDFWLRSDGHRRNPGTTADLITAGIFLGLVDQQLPFTP